MLDRGKEERGHVRICVELIGCNDGARVCQEVKKGIGHIAGWSYRNAILLGVRSGVKGIP